MSSKIEKAKSRLDKSEQSVIVRKKLYKSGKLWLASSLATVIFGATLIGTSVGANADTVSASTPSDNGSTVSTQGDTTSQKSVTLKTTVSANSSATATSTDATDNNTNTNVKPATTAGQDTSTDVQTSGEKINVSPDAAPSVSRTSDSTVAVKPQSADAIKSSATDKDLATSSAPKSETAAKTIDLGGADDATFNNAKEQALKEYLATGKAVTLTRTSADTTGKIDDATFTFTDQGVLTLQSGSFGNKAVSNQAFASEVKEINVSPGVSLIPGTEAGALFGNLPNVTKIDAHNLDVSQATGFGGIFVNDPKLTSVNISGWKTTKATFWVNMFLGDTSLKSVDLSGLDTSNATTMKGMFSGSGLETLDLSNFDMSKVTDATDMLTNMTNLWQLKLGAKDKLAGLNTGLPSTPAAGTKISDGTNTSTTSAPKWQLVGDGTALAPEGKQVSTDDILNSYDGSATATNATYVWAQDIQNTINLIDAGTGQKLGTNNVSGQFGSTVDLSKSLPTGYHYATGAELGTHTQPATPATIGKVGTAFTVYVVADPVIAINYVDDTDQSIVKTSKVSGDLNTNSDYTKDTDLAALEGQGYKYVSDDLPATLTFSADPATYTVHLTHNTQVIKGTDPTATAAQKKTLDIVINASNVGTTLTPDQVQPTGDTNQTLHYVRDTIIDEVLKAKGATPEQYTSYGDWYTNDTLTPVVAANVEGYTPNLNEISMDGVYNDQPMPDILKSYVQQSPGDATLTINFAYKINKYNVNIQYVDQHTGQLVGETESFSGIYQSDLSYPVVAPTGYEVVPDQKGITNNKMTLTFVPDMKTIQILVTPQVTEQNATVTYKTDSGMVLGTEDLQGNSGTDIPFDTADFVAKNFSGYSIVTDETATPVTFDTNTGSNQNFNVILKLKDVSTPLTPTGIDGKPIPGTTPKTITGQPGTNITDIPAIPGYTYVPGQTPTIPKVDGAVTTIYYTADNQNATINFIDQDGGKFGSLTASGASGTALDHANIATVIQQILNQGYNLTSDETVGATFDTNADKNQTFTVKLTKLADAKNPDVTQKAIINFVDQNNNSFGNLLTSGESNTAVDHHNVAALIQQILNQGYNLTSDGTVGATFDDDAAKDQTFTVSFVKLPAQTGDKTPGGPTGPQNGGGSPEGPTGPQSNTSIPEGPTGPQGDTNVPGGPSTETTPPEGGTVTTPNTPQGGNGETTGTDTEGGTASVKGGSTVVGKGSTVTTSDQNLSHLSAQGNRVAKSSTLPQTSEQSTLPFVILGLALLASFGALGYSGKKHYED
ncbi:lipoprotein [Secundilactobacillus pentosiphilus]|uniref:Lipoprotein n=1 Tax=Secundilactobacillus pentosiphilus TaxID=1714682 RepID=A0A1Z5IM53_9LACO|nr:BspA family leucine-rich repeat surface protein [Secundilactobacillus pentosiphilus]GAX02829.1 lipoprotein [Secundilactobacillus pentosiphilus]